MECAQDDSLVQRKSGEIETKELMIIELLLTHMVMEGSTASNFWDATVRSA